MYVCAGHHGAPRGADLEPVVRVARPLRLEDLLLAGGVQPAQEPDLRIDDVDAGAVAAQEPQRLLDRVLDDRPGVARARDPGAQLAQRALDDRLAGERPLRARELVDEAGVRHRERRVVGERADQGDLGRRERVGHRREHPERPEHLLAGGHRRDDQGADPGLPHESVGRARVDERRVECVVAGDGNPPLGHGPAEHADPDGELEATDPVVRTQPGDPGVVREPQAPGRRVEQVEDRAVGPEEAGRLLGGAPQERIHAGGQRRPGRGRGRPRSGGTGGRDGHGAATSGTTTRWSLAARSRSGVRHPSMPRAVG